MEELDIKLTAQELNFIVSIIKQISVSPAHPDALSILATSQSILSKVAKTCVEEISK